MVKISQDYFQAILISIFHFLAILSCSPPHPWATQYGNYFLIFPKLAENDSGKFSAY